MMQPNWFLPLMVVAAVTAAANGAVTEYTNKAAWQSAVANNYTTIDFQGYPNTTFITTQYADLGIIFTDGNDSIWHTPSYVNDGAGLQGNDIIHLSFSSPMQWIAMDFPGTANVKLLSQGNLIYTSGTLGGGGTGFFGGLVSSVPFDGAIIYRASGFDVEIDDLHFGPPIPAPSALALLGFGGMISRHRTRMMR